MARKKKTDVNPQITDAVTVVKGSHLTVTTYPDGKTELVWDDEALQRDVQKALTDYEELAKIKATETKQRKKKNEA